MFWTEWMLLLLKTARLIDDLNTATASCFPRSVATMFCTKSLILVSLLCAALSASAHYGIKKERVKLVDYNIGEGGVVNGLFRSGLIVNEGTNPPFVEIHKLREFLHNAATERGVQLTDKIYIVDVCLLHLHHSDQVVIDAEMKYFEEHPEDGRFVLNTLSVS